MNLRDLTICLLAAIIIPLTIPMMFDNDMPPCEYEDSQGPCIWDASERGNGEGTSFIVTIDGEIIDL